MKIPHDRLTNLVAAIFRAAGCQPPEHEIVARHLVESNLVGHDSHGVIRVPIYIQWLKEGKVLANQQMDVVFENDCLAVCDGRFGFGQSIGEQAVDLGIRKCRHKGVSVVALRNCGHLGRIGDWAIRAADAGIVSLHFVNTSGLGMLVPPYGGIDRRLSANPIAAGLPADDDEEPIILDISTSSIAEGKLKVAFNKGVDVPPGCIIDHEGRPTTDPKVFYGNPPGAILPFGGHKGYGLGVLAEVMAGALTGGGCTKPGITRLSNGMLSIYIEPEMLDCDEMYYEELSNFVEFCKTSRRVDPAVDILMPGQIESRTKAKREAEGIELDEKTWGQIADTAKALGVAV
jgi:hydroxycarboxylate dehydrogenase B